MKICIMGTGYVGLVSGTCLADLGNRVICVDTVKEKVDSVNNGKSHFYEPGLSELIKRNIVNKRLSATTDLKKAVEDSEVTFICVGTPPKKSGESDLTYLNKAAEEIGKILRDRDGHIVVVKSTVPPGTSESIIPILEKNSGKKEGEGFGVCMNPEFLREGNAVKDFMEPDRVVIGGQRKKDVEKIASMYKPLNAKVLSTDLRTAEMIKYASNSFLATKVSFINEVGNICKILGIDVYEVAEGMGLDNRISPNFLRAGCGFGGSCFPKDVSALVYLANKEGYKPQLLRATLDVNYRQPLRMLDVLEKQIRVKDKTIGILGLAFKAETDDVRDSPAIPVIKSLLDKKAKVIAYDPEAVSNFKKVFSNIMYAKNTAEVVEKSEALLLLTDWKQFAEIKTDKLVIDGKRVLSKEARGKNYHGICW